jgi:dihydroorotate dehydrogenase
MGFNNPGVEQGVRNVRATKHYSGIVGFNIGKNRTPRMNKRTKIISPACVPPILWLIM